MANLSMRTYRTFLTLKALIISTKERQFCYENMPVQIYWNFYHQKKSDIFISFLLKTKIVGTR